MEDDAVRQAATNARWSGISAVGWIRRAIRCRLRLLALCSIAVAGLDSHLAAAHEAVARIVASSDDVAPACSRAQHADGEVVAIEAVLDGVPAIVRIPRRIEKAPIVLWHGFGAPASERG